MKNFVVLCIKIHSIVFNTFLYPFKLFLTFISVFLNVCYIICKIDKHTLHHVNRIPWTIFNILEISTVPMTEWQPTQHLISIQWAILHIFKSSIYTIFYQTIQPQLADLPDLESFFKSFMKSSYNTSTTFLQSIKLLNQKTRVLLIPASGNYHTVFKCL